MNASRKTSISKTPITPAINPEASLREQVELSIRQWISEGRYAPGEQLPTAKEIARICSINDQTVRRGIKNLIDEGLLRGAQGKGVFVAQHNLKHKRIALVIPNLADEMTILIARGTQKVFDAAGLQCLILDAARDADKESVNISNLLSLPVDGAIIFPLASGSITERIIQLKMANFPFVLVDKYIPNLELNCVTADDFGGMHQLTELLIKRGYRLFSWISGEPNSTSVSNRFEGFRWALGDNGIALARKYVEEIQSPSPTADVTQDIQKAIKRIVGYSPRPEIIVCANDLIADCAIRQLQELGLSIPGQIGVSGFDALKQNISTHISITSASKPIEQMGTAAAELLLALLGPGQHTPKQVVLPVHPVMMNSTR